MIETTPIEGIEPMWSCVNCGCMNLNKKATCFNCGVGRPLRKPGSDLEGLIKRLEIFLTDLKKELERIKHDSSGA
jgi:hypothetical protein